MSYASINQSSAASLWVVTTVATALPGDADEH
jgi:hypothetical protein